MSTISGTSSSNAWSAMSTSRADMKDKLFAKVDSDGSGAVDTTELQSMLDDLAKRTGSASSTSAADALNKLDSNGDGSLDKDELDKGMKDLLPAPSSTMAFAQARGPGGGGGPGGPPPAAGASDSSDTSSSTEFDPLDTNKDGVVSEQERAAGEAKDVFKTLLKAVDTDGDKQISDSEFSQFEDMLSQAVSNADKPLTLSSLSDLVLKEYGKAAANSATQQSVGSTLSVAA